MAPRCYVPDFFNVHADKIQKHEGACWEWTAAKHSFGYGNLGLQVDGLVYTVLAHRAAYEAANGQDSARGSFVLHRCHNPSCVNPSHLELGDHAKNMQQMVDAGHSQKGIKNPFAVLDEEQVIVIRQLLRDGQTLTGVARRFGVFHQTIKHAAVGSTWGHLPHALPAADIQYGKGARKLLTAKNAATIRRLVVRGVAAKVLAEEYGVSKSTIMAIKHNRIWAAKEIAA